MTKQFFAKDGLTETSAQYYSNLALEQLKADEAWLNSISFIEETQTLLSSGKEMTTKVSNVKDLSNIKKVINRCAKLYTFIAYIREAMKAKDEAFEHLLSFSEWQIQENISLTEPSMPTKVTMDDLLAEMSLAELTKYYELQQYSATFGKQIHKDGSIARARNSGYNYASNPIEVNNLSNDVVVIKRDLAFEIDNIDNMYNELQSERREYDKQFNHIKFDLICELNERNNKLDQEFAAAYEKYMAELQVLRSKYEIWYRNAREDIATNWKIQIPERLQSTFNWLQSLDKKVNK